MDNIAIFISTDGKIHYGLTHNDIAKELNSSFDELMEKGYIRINLNKDFLTVEFKNNVSITALHKLKECCFDFLKRSEDNVIIIPETPFKEENKTIEKYEDLYNFHKNIIDILNKGK